MDRTVVVTSDKDISNVAVGLADGSVETFDGLSGTTWQYEFDGDVLWVVAKSGTTVTIVGAAHVDLAAAPGYLSSEELATAADEEACATTETDTGTETESEVPVTTETESESDESETEGETENEASVEAETRRRRTSETGAETGTEDEGAVAGVDVEAEVDTRPHVAHRDRPGTGTRGGTVGRRRARGDDHPPRSPGAGVGDGHGRTGRCGGAAEDRSAGWLAWLRSAPRRWAPGRCCAVAAADGHDHDDHGRGPAITGPRPVVVSPRAG